MVRRSSSLMAAVCGLAAAALPMSVCGRAAAAETFTVTSTADPGNGSCVSAGCTLREAIDAANATAGADVVAFDIPGAGVHTIRPATALPTITEALTIDGYTQTGAAVNDKAAGTNAVLLIELSGGDAPFDTPGLSVAAGPTTIRGLVINGFDGNGGNGIVVGHDADDQTVIIEGNFIGTDPSGTLDEGNGQNGLSLRSTSPSVDRSTVGGSSPAARNLISGNDRRGLFIGSDGTAEWIIQGNLIGTDRTGNAGLGNGVGGGATSRGGIYLNGANDTVIVENVIAYNDGFGVGVNDVGPTEGNRVVANSIFKNTGLGIDLAADGPTPNDRGPPADTDTGPNGLQNFPRITVAKPARVKAKIVTTEPGTSVRFDFYMSPNPSLPAKTFLGSKVANSDSEGRLSVTFKPSTPLTLGRLVTATATTNGDGTSEFSAPRIVE